MDPILLMVIENSLISVLFGYLFGSIPVGLILCLVFGYGDIRKIGSGNIGATNVLRTGNKILAFVTLFLDSGKGAIAVLLAVFMDVLVDIEFVSLGFVALGAVLGHCYPVWLKFKGGKGVATTIGAILALSWPVGLSMCVVWLVSAFIFRISSLSALISMVSAPIFLYFVFDGPRASVELFALLSFIVIVRHEDNIKRLLKGEEAKIKFKKAGKT